MARAVARLPAIDFDRFVHNGRFGRIARFQRSKVDEQLESRAGLANGLSRSIIVGADIIESAHPCANCAIAIQTGSESCRERECQYVSIWRVNTLTKKKTTKITQSTSHKRNKQP